MKGFVGLSICVILCVMTGCGAHIIATTALSRLDTKVPGGGSIINKVKVYELGRDIYYQFIENPSYDILDRQGSKTGVSIYSLSTTSAGLIEVETISYRPGSIYEYGEGMLRIGSASGLAVYGSLIDFAGNKTEIKKYLAQKGVTASIESVCVISGLQITDTIWVKTDKGNYFITIDEKQEDYINDPQKTTYVYRFYTQTEYCQKFSPKNCTLIINGKDITSGNYEKLYYNYADLPMTAIMKALGAKVEWQNKTTALITCGDKKYILNTTKCTLFDVGKPQDDDLKYNIITVFPGGYRFYKVVGDEFVLDSSTMGRVVALMGAKINIDYEKAVITIG